MRALRQLTASDLYPYSGIFAHAEVDETVRFAVRQELIRFDPPGHDRQALYNREAIKWRTDS
jgi:hypothetical protein